jgi:DNA-binding winged helix-turn-helix (wHTH) protein/tetratricopeptide (TPR) repeat protein
MQINPIYLFGDYRLDTANAQLLKLDREVPLPPKAFAVLVHLIERHGLLVTKDELLDAVWERRYVTEGVLKTTMQILRQALVDDSKTPRYLETVHRRGYRFIAEVTASASRLSGPDQVQLVGRDTELEQLHHSLARALSGTPQLVFVTGEAGIGKTTVIEHFLASSIARIVIAYGQCVEQYGQSEPYLPILEALNAVCRQQGESALTVLANTAPDWLAELPWLDNKNRLKTAHEEEQPNSQARMLRELGELLQQWSMDFPLLLVLEDLHWSDWATLDALAFLVRRKNSARWLIVASYRPERTISDNQPLAKIVRDLQLHGLSQEIALPLLSEPAVTDYLKQRCGINKCNPDLIAAIYRRSEGLPFFMAQLAENIDRLSGDALQSLPEGLQFLIEQQFERLSADQQDLLNSAAVAGVVFSVPLLAKLTGRTETLVESQCETLLRSRNFLTQAQSIPGHYAFLHAYYHEYVYRRLPAFSKAKLHRQTAYWLEQHVHAGIDDTLSALALHFEQGGVFDKAVDYLQQAVNLAIRRHAPHEVIQLARRALAILETPSGDTGQQSEQQIIGFYTALIVALQATQGFACAELRPIYERVLRSAEKQNNPVQMSAILWGLGCFFSVQGEMIEARDRCWQPLCRLAESSGAILATICGQVGMGGAEMYAGNLSVAENHLQQAIDLFDFNQHAGQFNLIALHPLVLCYSLRAQTAWLLGFPDQALRMALDGVELALASKQPFSLSFAQWSVAMCSQMRGDFAEAADRCDAALALSHEHGFILIDKLAILVKGWASLKKGDHQNGVKDIYTGLNLIRDTGGKLMQSQLLAFCCDACLEAGLYDDARILLGHAEEVVAQQRRECFFEAELYRLQGELLLVNADPDPDAAQALFRKALAIADRQGAKALALRAALSLERLLNDQGGADAAWQVLHGIHAGFEEGFDTPDLQQAAAMLKAWAATD